MKALRIAATLLVSLTVAPGFAMPVRVVDDINERLQQLSAGEMDDVLWLARCLFSEADRPNEQGLVAWVVRNRVETEYRGSTYRDVVLETKQFSAFNAPTPRRAQILSFNQHSTNPLWRQSLGIALDVYKADSSERPFSATTRHFYSPVSMPNHATPDWAQGVSPIDVSAYDIDPFRFRFYDQVDSTATGDGTPVKFATSERIEAQRQEVRRPSTGRLRSRLSGRVARPTRPSVGKRNS